MKNEFENEFVIAAVYTVGLRIEIFHSAVA